MFGVAIAQLRRMGARPLDTGRVRRAVLHRMTTRRRTYDHRIKQQVILSGNPNLFPELGIPRATTLNWIRRGMVQSKQHRHMSIRGLALHAQRVGKVFAHPATWSRLIRDRGWRRPRLRVYPPKPKVGVRASAPNEAWHVDVTLLKLLDGTKAYLHAVIDNYSRKILAWTVAGHLDSMNTCRVLQEAAPRMTTSAVTSVYMDSGVENVNGKVDELVGAGPLERVLAQIDVSFSNSMIEAWWRSLKHQWLYLNHLDSLATVTKLVGFYVEQHNAVMPHAAFRGQTPDEMYLGTGGQVADDLAGRRREALRRRLERNREVACTACPKSRGDEAA